MQRLLKPFVLILLLFLPSTLGASGAYPYRMPEGEGIDREALTVIGAMRTYRIGQKDTMLDIARAFDLGYQELMLLHPEIDPWLPPVGKDIVIPTFWVLPLYRGEGIVINVPELRLYLYMPRIGLVKTYPIGIGVEDWPTPFGRFRVLEKEVNPTWDIPPSLREKYGGLTSIPPGPGNPLGRYWIRLSNTVYGIHGTNSPWGIGRLVSHGCIRLYPEDIEKLFPLVKVGTPVLILYEPVKYGFREGRIYVEVHPDIYRRIPDLVAYGLDRAISLGLMERIDLLLLLKALKEKKGVPLDVTKEKVRTGSVRPSARRTQSLP